ncbi:Hypothetical protein SCLAV_5626 [Streptomyces clavuligerus]|uniref:Uncharacterized protein n=1 Tax=Streptomyces clavuligerus TaxID=1901 RepID=E2Q1R7_STRCL|nr:Hypothetical protein SCLAV_5626 [Streptomyces clavuligerus]
MPRSGDGPGEPSGVSGSGGRPGAGPRGCRGWDPRSPAGDRGRSGRGRRGRSGGRRWRCSRSAPPAGSAPARVSSFSSRWRPSPWPGAKGVASVPAGRGTPASCRARRRPAPRG